MRVNVYAEEMTDKVEIIEKKGFTGLRIYLELPASFVPVISAQTNEQIGHMPASVNDVKQAVHFQAPFIHHPGDDDSSAVTFWGKRDLRIVLRKALAELDKHYANKSYERAVEAAQGQGL